MAPSTFFPVIFNGAFGGGVGGGGNVVSGSLSCRLVYPSNQRPLFPHLASWKSRLCGVDDIGSMSCGNVVCVSSALVARVCKHV